MQKTALRPEALYVLSLCRAFVFATQTPLPPSDVDVTQVIEFLGSQRLLVTLGPLLLDSVVPEKRSLRQAIRDLNRRHAIVWLELVRAVDVLGNARIPCVVLKGLALGQTVYPEPTNRFVSDIDVLVAPGTFDHAMDVLARNGYRVSPTQRHLSFYRRHHFHVILDGPARVPLELHWNLSRPGDYFQFDPKGFVDRSRAVDRDGMRLRVPSDGDQLLHAACQALRDGYSDVRRVLDAALLLRHGAAADADLGTRAKRQRMAKPLWLLLHTQQKLLGTLEGEALVEEMRPPAFVRRCIESLDPAGCAVTRHVFETSGTKRLLLWLCSPSLASALAHIRDYVFPGEAQLLDFGFSPEALLDPMKRSRLMLQRAVTFVKLLIHFGVRVIVGPPPGPSSGGRAAD